jgi:ribose-phosphate pyrophosphokinase
MQTRTPGYARTCPVLNLENPKHFNFWDYNGGEIGCRVVCPLIGPIDVRARINSPAMLVKLILATDVIKRNHDGPLGDLYLGYMPYARQDKIHADGDGLSLQAIAQQIDILGYARIHILDPHSDVVLACFTRTKVVIDDGSKHFMNFMGAKNPTRTAMVIPDVGAIKRCTTWAKVAGITNLIQALKNRDPATGDIKDITLQEEADLRGIDHIIIADDICDRGGTFLGILAALNTAYPNRNIPPVSLYVSHGIFPDETLEKLAHKFHGIGTTDTCRDFDLIACDPLNVFAQLYLKP